ncbi:MAG: M23 family metallopeptidase [Rhodospirillales bacterium]
MTRTERWILAAILVFTVGSLSGIAAAQAAECEACKGMEGFVEPSEIPREIFMMVGADDDGLGDENVAVQKARGVIETGLVTAFAAGGQCPEIDSETWAIDYTHKRPRAALHKGVDIPQPRGTSIRAIAAGVVVGKSRNRRSRKGIEVVLRHRPEDTGLPFWTYSQYTHLEDMSPLVVGAVVAMGDEIGRTGNSGKQGRRERRDALHLAVLYSPVPEWSNDGKAVLPKDGRFMDPAAFYRLSEPWESVAAGKLSGAEKQIPVPWMDASGKATPPDTKRIWPYPCR